MLVLSVQGRGMASMRFFWPAVAARRGSKSSCYPLFLGGDFFFERIKQLAFAPPLLLAGMAARCQPPSWRPVGGFLTGARHDLADKWFVPGSESVTGAGDSSLELGVRAQYPQILMAMSGDRRRAVVEAFWHWIAFSLFVSGCLS
jgi:hypothetical protein